jgi:hypothetical protein
MAAHGLNFDPSIPDSLRFSRLLSGTPFMSVGR